MEPIVNRVAESDITVYNLEALWDGREVVEFDIEPFLFQGLVVREKEFRENVKNHDWARLSGKHVAVFCSTDAIVPTWAYMLIASKLDGIAASVAFGSRADLIRDHFARKLEAEDWSRFRDGIVVIKGCGSKVVPPNAYLVATQKLQGVVRKLMFGEPCSSVPIWRKPVEATGGRPKAAPVKVALPAGGGK